MKDRNSKNLWTNKYFVALMATIACVLWGSAFPVLKLTYGELQLHGNDTISRVFLAGLRFFLAAILLFSVYRMLFKQSTRIKRSLLRPLFFLGLSQTALQYYFFYNGLAHTEGIKAAILNVFGNLLVVLVAHFIYADDRLNLGKVVGLITGFAGIIIINWQGGGHGFSWNLSFKGEGFMLLSGVASVYGTFQAKKLAKDLNPVLINAYQFFFGSLVLLVLSTPRLTVNSFQATSLFWILLVYSAILSAAAFSIWYTLLRYNKAGEVTLYRFVIPISGTLLSALFLPEESISFTAIFALGLVVLGLIVVNYWGKKEKAIEEV